MTRLTRGRVAGAGWSAGSRLDYGGTCTIRKGTWLFTAVFTNECSNIEADPYHADNALEAALCGAP